MTDLHKAISGALFDFAGFLTTRPMSTPFGSCEDANPAVEMLKEWADTRGLQLDEADVENWSAALREALAAPVVPECNPHPKAPHGFDRNASHSSDRYVCDCASWEPYDAGYQAGFQAGLAADAAPQPKDKP